MQISSKLEISDVTVFENVLKFQGFPMEIAERDLRKIQHLPPREFVHWQARQRRKIVQYHLANNPFYKNQVGSRIDTWEELPILRKQDYQRPIEELLAQPYGRTNVYRASTSGSSGHPFHFAKNKHSHAMDWAIQKHRYGLYGLSFKSKQARFFGIPKSINGFLFEKAKDHVMNRSRFSVFDLSNCKLEGFLRRFRGNNFDYIYGYTHSLVLFAQFVHDQGLKLVEVCPSLKVCLTTSEMCTPDDRTVMEQGFGVPVVNEYGTSETGILGFEFPDGSWRLSEETIYAETTATGEILVTSLFNKAFPIIRYNIGDIGKISDTRIDGKYRQLLLLTGRTNDVITLPSGRKAAGLTFYYISKRILEKSGVLREFVVRQRALDTFEFELVADRDLTEGEERMMRREVEYYLEDGLRVEFRRVSRIERPASGKLKHFYAEFTT